MENIQFLLLTPRLPCASQAQLHPLGQGKPEVQQPCKHLFLQHVVSGWTLQAPGISSSEEKLRYWVINGPETVVWIIQNVTTPAFQSIKYNIIR